MAQFQTLCESVNGHGDKWTELIASLTDLHIAAQSAEEAQEIAEQHLTAKIGEIMDHYQGPHGTEPTGLSGLVISVEPA